jgi:hypothetical protein
MRIYSEASIAESPLLAAGLFVILPLPKQFCLCHSYPALLTLYQWQLLKAIYYSV